MNSIKNSKLTFSIFAAIALTACLVQGGTNNGPTSPIPPAASGAGGQAAPADAAPIYKDAKASPAARTDDLLRRMTADEKLAYIGGVESMCIREIPRLGVPKIKMSDGPLGCRCWGKATAFPGGTCIAASWNRELARQVGVAMGRDCRARGVHILLAPGVNIYRSAKCGRNFEYAGEDPFLAGQMASAEIQGLQSQGVLGTIKHFAGNNQETGRGIFDSQIDERTLREIYLPAFEAAVKEGKVWCVMDAYNKLNGSYCTQSSFLNNQVLRKDWGFSGLVMSDWGAVHNLVEAANNGLDLEMPSGQCMSPKGLLAAIKDGKVQQSTIDEKVRHILFTLISNGFLDRAQELRDLPKEDPANIATSLEAAQQGIVLLKNKGGVLPLDLAKIRRVAVVGPNADAEMWSAGGSARMRTPVHSTSVLQGITDLASADKVLRPAAPSDPVADAEKQATYEGPITMEVFNNRQLEGSPVATQTTNRIFLDLKDKPLVEGVGLKNFSVRWNATIKPGISGYYLFSRQLYDGGRGMRVFLDDKLILNDWSDEPRTGGIQTAGAELTAGKTYKLRAEFNLGGGKAGARVWWARQDLEPVVQAAKDADAVVVSAGFGPFTESEGYDRTYELPAGQLRLIQAVATANPRTIVVLNGGGGMEWQGWLDKVPAVLHAWYPGQDGGRAVAEILFGAVNPSGKLPMTFEKRLEDNPSSPTFLREADNNDKKVVYGEGIFVGYRGYDQGKIEPQFCFGHGLSYTTFEYGNLSVSPKKGSGGETVTATFAVKNTGQRAGAEVAQLYVSDPGCRIPRPPKELKGFERVMLNPGESKTVTIKLDRRAFSFFHPETKKWTVQPGKFTILVGPSSRELPLKTTIEYSDE